MASDVNGHDHGRAEARAVRGYLDALRHDRPRPGRKRSAATVQRQLTDTIEQLTAGDADPITELRLHQQRITLTAELDKITTTSRTGIADTEPEFIAHAAGYSARHGISWAAWRHVGVPAAVLTKAGVTRR